MRYSKKQYNIFLDNITLDDKNYIIQSYTDGKSIVKLAKEYNVRCEIMSHYFEDNNIPRRPVFKIYSENENFFDIIDTQDKAYILGFLYADGTNTTSRNTICMALQEDDFEILEKIRITLEATKPLEYLEYKTKHPTWKNQYRLVICNKHMSDRLLELGVLHNKSLILKFPNDINDALIPHFIRGYFDGDGGVYVYLKKDNYYRYDIRITSTYDFVIKLQNIITNKLGIYSSIIDMNYNNITKTLIISGKKNTEIFLNWIYDDANLFMKRKHDIYLKFYKNCVA